MYINSSAIAYPFRSLHSKPNTHTHTHTHTNPPTHQPAKILRTRKIGISISSFDAQIIEEERERETERERQRKREREGEREITE